MEKQYDVFCKMKQKEMSKAISDMTYGYINPETNSPTLVPAAHYDKILGLVKEQFIDVAMQNEFLNIAYDQLKRLKTQDPKYFYQALLCLDMNIKPNYLRTNERLSLTLTYDAIEDKENNSKKEFNFLNQDILDLFISNRDNKQLHAEMLQPKGNVIEENEEEIELDY